VAVAVAAHSRPVIRSIVCRPHPSSVPAELLVLLDIQVNNLLFPDDWKITR
jgi:hypothetical protein